MRSHKERRKAEGMPSSVSLEDNGRTSSIVDRGKQHDRRIGSRPSEEGRRAQHDRRIENLGADELQLMFSEMPSPTTKKPS